MSSLAPPPASPAVVLAGGRPWSAPALSGALALTGTIVLGLGNPNTTKITVCPLAMVGIDCPFCGSLRAVHSLTRLDIVGALDHNAFFTLLVPALIVSWAIWLLRSFGRPAFARWRLPSATLAVLTIVGIAFAILRNVPAFAWLGSGAWPSP